MRFRIGLSAIVVVVLLAVGIAPAGAGGGGGQHDRWTGNWRVGTKRDHQFVAFGRMHLRLHNDDKTVTGHYEFSGGGTIEGELNQRFGRHLEGTYKQPNPNAPPRNVKGKFEFSIPHGEPDEFRGRSWQTQPSCFFGCPKHYREGHRL